MRKDAGYNIADRIRLWVDGDEAVRTAARRHAEYIAGETLAVALDVGGAEPAADVAQSVDLDGITARIAVQRAA
jgi:isoleucyl-tRNA synthetase